MRLGALALGPVLALLACDAPRQPAVPVVLRVVLATTEVVQYEPVLASVYLASRSTKRCFAEVPDRLHAEVWHDGEWVSPYSLPGAARTRQRDTGIPVWCAAGPAPPVGPELSPGAHSETEVELSDLEVIVTPGRYRVRASSLIDESKPAGSLAQDPVRARTQDAFVRVGRALSPWVELRVLPSAPNERVLGAARRRKRDLLWLHYQAMIQPDLHVNHVSADAILASGVTDGVLTKARLFLAWQHTTWAIFGAADAKRHYEVALAHLCSIVPPASRPPTGGIAPLVLALRGVCELRTGDGFAGTRAFDELRRSFPSFVRRHPGFVMALGGSVEKAAVSGVPGPSGPPPGLPSPWWWW